MSSRSAAGRCFELLGVARAPDRDRGRSAFDLGEVVPRQLDIRRAEVLLEPVELCGTGNRHDPRLLPEEPRDRDLRESRVLLFRDSAEQVDAGFGRSSTRAWSNDIARLPALLSGHA